MAINIVFQAPKCVITMGMGHDAGLAEVPEARFIRNIEAGFMSTMLDVDPVVRKWSSCEPAAAPACCCP